MIKIPLNQRLILTISSTVKKAIVLSTLLLCSVFAKSQCNFQWSPEERAITTQWGSVYYQIQTSNCVNGGICGWPKVALSHTFTYKLTTLSITLGGIQCDGTSTKMTFSSTDLDPRIWDKGQGNWHTFKEVNQLLGVDLQFNVGNDVYRVLYDKENGINQTYKNGQPI
ncbi:MAG TPA: hypothetical protein VK718_10630 [Ferruginibacter sp.]|jgi:hypothetical protein|nr:hypothetical protein [Ferruginibacter sp.]